MLCLKGPTDTAWAADALGDIDAVLADHAHCEMKAAANALSLAARQPADILLAQALAEVAREEIEHFHRVLGILIARGAALGPPPVDDYAADLHRAVAKLPRRGDVTPVVDRLLVSAIIEARSCERFKLLAQATADGAGPPVVHALWSELMASEAQHYRTFVDLAVRAAGGARPYTLERLERLAELEAAIVAALPLRRSGGGGEKGAVGATRRKAIHG